MRETGDGNDGLFVVFEGIDGAGTTTQAERYASYLRSRRRLVHVTCEPSVGPIGAQIRQVLRQRLSLAGAHQAEILALLFAADRLDHIETEIAPHLRDGYVVLSDRYDLSSLAYQSTTVTDLPPELASQSVVDWIRTINGFAQRPDVTLVLDVTPTVAASRRLARGGAAELYDDAEFQARLADAYRQAEQLVPGDRVIHVDGDRAPDSVAADIIAALDPFVSSPCAPILR